MKKAIVFFSILALIGFALPTNAQCQKEGHNCSGHAEMCKMTHPKLLTPSTVQLLKENYIKENLELKDNQKDAFWKSYNKYQKALEQAHADAKATREKANIPCCKDPKAQFTDAQKVALYNIQLNKRQAELTAEQTFFKEISKNLTEAQIASYLDLEKNFKMEINKLQGTPKDLPKQKCAPDMKCNRESMQPKAQDLEKHNR